MRFNLTDYEIQLLSSHGIQIIKEREYSDDEALGLLDLVYDAEVFYAQDADENKLARKMAQEYARIADKIQKAIPEI